MVVASIRALYSEMPEHLAIAKDPHASKLLPFPMAIPAQLAKRASVRSTRDGALVHERLSRITLGLTAHVALRTFAIDDALRESTLRGVKQVVLLGAGLDGRGYRMKELSDSVVFEVDHPSTQEDKRVRVEERGLKPSAKEVRRVPVDFERDDLFVSLSNAGFSPDEPSFWIWEGVTMYLTPEAIVGALSTIGRMSADGSRVALTYVRPRPDGLERALLAGGRVAMHLIGEPLSGFLEPEELAALGQKEGLFVHSDEAADTWAERYWSERSAGPFEWERLSVLERRR